MPPRGLTVHASDERYMPSLSIVTSSAWSNAFSTADCDFECSRPDRASGLAVNSPVACDGRAPNDVAGSAEVLGWGVSSSSASSGDEDDGSELAVVGVSVGESSSPR